MFTELLISFFNAMSERDELLAMIAVLAKELHDLKGRLDNSSTFGRSYQAYLDELRKKAAKVEVK